MSFSTKISFKKIRNTAFLLLVGGILVESCKKDPQITDSGKATDETPVVFQIPQGWPTPFYQFDNNKLSNAGFELGRKLFFDPRLSRDNTVSCGSCHQPFAAFAQLDHPVSHGVDNLLGKRNSPALFNLNWHTSFFWDGGVNHIEAQPINPIQNPVEMDENLPDIITKLNADADYRAQFKNTFGDETINSQRIFKAICQFMGMLVSNNSKYDHYMRGEAGGSMTAQELSGLQIFKTNCASCHKEPLFTDFSFRNNGLMPTAVNDSGRAHITRDIADLYKFKVPSLRNLKYSAPYMHDGRFSKLDSVLAHYDHGIQPSPTLDPALQNGIHLSVQERADLLAFLNTLNDETFIKDPRFQEPKP
ncbi:cytochrome-c peroxidase [Taibaiella soli]|uniref:Cytochrome-c peroxidase n=1 Tax=Taibaiella soli TaxID=1649169 RepID=A0A2W2AC91_9BACT|nr:cytochrome c peroxidase [Taibaiella soli]PZF73045.1 cytochrome-c peroxidase [Taibaiella soli]